MYNENGQYNRSRQSKAISPDYSSPNTQYFGGQNGDYGNSYGGQFQYNTQSPTQAAYASSQSASTQSRQPPPTSTHGGGTSTTMAEDDEFQNETLYFERNRIQHLKDERIHIQKKTFTKWCNSYLNKARMEINDLFTDFGDGILLLRFLEIISGEKLGKPNRGRMRVQKIENLNKCLEFLKYKRIQLENIGAEDILDGNERLILGLIWTIILRFTIENIEIEGKESGERKHAKEALLLWCQRKTAGYPSVKIDNFTSSWRNGLAFNALIHAHRPELVGFESLNAQDAIGNLNSAFDIAEKKLDIARLLDAEDIIVSHPDEKSIITYVSLYYHYFAKQKTELTGARRVAKVVGGLVEQDGLQDDYEQLSSELLIWIQRTIEWLTNRQFPNSLREMQTQLLAFNEYRKVDKPPKYKEKGDLEALFFAIQTKRNAMKRRQYLPPEGLFIHDVESAWNQLDKAENERQVALIHELQRQERLEVKAKIFHKKAEVRDAWLREIINVLKNFEFAPTITKVEAASKMLRNISTQAGPKTDRFKMLSEMSAELQRDNFYDSEAIRQREREIIDRWNQFLAMLHQKEKQLAGLRELTALIRDLDTLASELRNVEPSVKNRDLGKHMLAVSDYLQKHELIEANINANGEWLQNLRQQALDYVKRKGEMFESLQAKLDEVEEEFARLLELCRERRVALARARDYFHFVESFEEEMNWLAEKVEFCAVMLNLRDISNVPHATRQYKVLESEMQAHWQRTKGIINAGERLSSGGATSRDDVQQKIGALQSRWERLRKIATALAKWLEEAEQACQYFQDANDTESWIKEKMPLVCSDDFGRDLSAAESLYSRHLRLVEEIQAYRADIHRLDEAAAQLARTQFNFDAATSAAPTGNELDSAENDADVQMKMEELIVPKVVALYAFDGKGDGNGASAVHVKRDELLALLDKTNADWWRVLKHDGTEGYVPANYCRLIPGETVTVSQQVAVSKPPKTSKSKKRSADTSDASCRNAILQRQTAIGADYSRLTNLAQNRQRFLADAIKLFKFYHHCDDFEAWVKETSVLFQEEVTVEHIEALRKKFKKLENDLQTIGGAQLKQINDMADELVTQGHTHSENIGARQRRVTQLWNELQELWKSKADDLASAERMAAFNESCADTRSWIGEKFTLLEKRADANDLKALQTLQRRYQNLERDLKPLDERIRQLRKMATEIIARHPEHRADVERAMAELGAMHADLIKQARLRINEAEQTQGQQMFDNTARELLDWVSKTHQSILIDADSTAHATNIPAEEIVKRHLEIRDEVLAKEYEFDYVKELGNRLLAKNAHLTRVDETLNGLARAKTALDDAWLAKDNEYKQLLELQVFGREADRIDALTKGHEAFLDLNNLGDTAEGVENLIKAHSDFESKLMAQEDRVRAFAESADRLIDANHRHAEFIEERRATVLQNRERVYALATQRRARLDDALVFQNLRRSVDELSAWIGAKQRVADVSYVETAEAPVSLDRQLLKHEAFVAELNFNAIQLDNVNKDGNALVAQNHCDKTRITSLLKNLNRDWNQLADMVKVKSEKLAQRDTKNGLMKMINDVHARLDEIEKELTLSSQGNDLRSVKELIKRKNAIDQEVNVLQQRITDISQKAQKMVADGHYDAQAILSAVDNLNDRFAALQDPLEKRRLFLEESLKCHQLVFDADVELQWIEEKRLVAESRQLARTLTEATNMLKKHDQLDMEIDAHEPKVKAILENGNALRNDVHKHLFSPMINAKCEELLTAWKTLNNAVAKRRSLLAHGVAKEQYLFDLAEVEAWIAEKHRHILNQSEKVDEISAPKVLSFIRTIINDMTLYKETLAELSAKCAELCKSDEDVLLSERQEKVETDFAFLGELAEDKCAKMENFILLFVYNNESRDLETWINAQLQLAISEDYGQDYEHLLAVKSKFEEFKQSVRTGTERFVLCEQSARQLLDRAPPFARDIVQRQDKLRAVWTLLLEYMESRETKLAAAEQLHKFNRDVYEMEERMNEKRAALSHELGRDAKHACSLILKHEVFEHELDQLQEQLNELIKKGADLQSTYPGANSEQIGEQLTALGAGWNDLKEATMTRGNRLLASYELHKFLSRARDFMCWCSMANAEMQSDQKVRDLQTAEWIQQEHHRLRSEIEARHNEFMEIKEVGENLLEQNHYASAEVADRLAAVEDAYANVKQEWKLRNEWIEQIVDWHGFEREARQNIAAIEARERTLAQSEVGGSVEDVEAQMRRFDTFTRALGQLEERVSALGALADQLIKRKHMEAPNIDMWNRKVLNALNHLGAQLDAFKRRLQFALVLARFDSEVAEMSRWIDEKSKRIKLQTNDAQLAQNNQQLTLSDKLAHLKRHQALEIELSANAPRIDALSVQLGKLKRDQKEHASSANGGGALVVPPDVIERGEKLMNKWKDLNDTVKHLNAALKEAKDLFDFNESAERILRWIRDKELIIGAQDLGRDYEHANALLEKLIGKDSDQSVDLTTIQHINNLGAKLIALGSDSRDEIENRLNKLNDAWTNFQGRMDAYQEMLRAALSVHRFNGDVDETNTRIQEKAALLASDELGRNLADVERLLRKQDATERDMSAIHKKLNVHDDEAKALLAIQPPLAETVAASLRKLEVSWQELAELAHTRRLNLQQSYNLQKYFDAVKKLEQWATAMRTKMSSYLTARSVRDAENALKTHDERLAEIESRNDELKSLREYGQKISAEQPEHKAEIQRAHRRLQNIEHQIRQTWEQENVILKQALQLQTLYAQILQTESWLTAKEAFVNQYELGDSVDAVEILLRKYDAFTQTLLSQNEKIEQLRSAAVGVLPLDERGAPNALDKSPEVERIMEKYGEILQRYDQLLASCETKRQRLHDSRKLHAFIRECGEVIMWMNAKLQLAYDDAFIDPTNLRSKLQKHLAFDAELNASAERVDALKRNGERLIAENCFDAERVEAQLNEVLDGWNELKTKSASKAKKLQESYEAHQLSRRLTELDKWLDGIEHSLSTNDHGSDVVSVESLIRRHAQLRDEIEAKRAAVEDVLAKAKKLGEKEFEEVDELMSKANSVYLRYNGLGEPSQIRCENLNDSLKFFQWASEVDEQLAWINAKVPQLESTDYGRSLHSAQSLNKKHQILEQEIGTRAPIIDALMKDARVSFANISTSSKDAHFAPDLMVGEIRARIDELRDGFDLLGSLSASRALKLVESLRSQEYYAEAGEAEQWIREHLQVIVAANDEASSLGAGGSSGSAYAVADVHLRRLGALEKEIDAFADEVQRLRKIAENMTSASHFDSAQISTRQSKLEDLFDALRLACRKRRAQLVDASRYQSFIRQLDDLIAWLREKKILAEREDYGTDLEDCAFLIEQFEQVVRELSAAGERVAAVQKIQEGLLRSSHPNAGSIRAKSQDLEQLWHDVNEAANDRQQALLDGKNIHVFDQKADEMLNRLAEQEAYIVALDSEELTVGDSATVQAFLQKHDDFLHALYVLEKQVSDVCREADRIIQQFPRTREHLDVRRDELIEQLKDVQDGGRKFSERLAQAQKNQAYFQEYRDLMNWIRHIYMTITGEILPRDVAGCEALNARHAEYRTEIQAHELQKSAFVENGRKMIQSGNALSQEIAGKVNDLEHGFKQLYETWHRRQIVYDENLDVQQWLSSAEFLENWLTERQQFLTEDWHTVEGVEGVDDLIRHFDDFLATFDAQTPHFEALKRLTKLETSYRKMQQQESNGLRRRESSSVSTEPSSRRDTQQIKTLEKKKLLQEKRQERERRKTQEISLMKRTPSQESGADFTTLPRVRATNRNSMTGAEFQGQVVTSMQTGGITITKTVSDASKRNSIVLDRPPNALIVDAADGTGVFYSADETRNRAHTTEPSSSGDGDAKNEKDAAKVALRRRQSLAAKTPGFTTRRPQSIKKMRQWDELNSIDMQGYIDRKQELQGGGKKATFRSWKNYYTILCGQLLCFFKDEESFMENMAAAPPVYIMNASCVVHADYIKRKHTFKLNTKDGAEYLFAADTNEKMIEWVEKINFHAALSPSNQLVSFKEAELPSSYYMPQSSTNYELSRSHTLELSASYPYQQRASTSRGSSARNSIYVGDDMTTIATINDRKFATLDHPRRASPSVLNDAKPKRQELTERSSVLLLAPSAEINSLNTASDVTMTFAHSTTTIETATNASSFQNSHGSSIGSSTLSYPPAQDTTGNNAPSSISSASTRNSWADETSIKRTSQTQSRSQSYLNGSEHSPRGDPKSEFVNWVETQSARNTYTAMSSSHKELESSRKKSTNNYGSGEDTESLKSTTSKKRSVISLFKRSSKNFNK